MSQSANNPDICTELFNSIYNETFIEMRKFVASKCTDVAYISDILQEIYLEYYKLILRHGVNYATNNQAVIFKIAKRKLYRYYSFRDKLKIFTPLYKLNNEGEEYAITDISDEDMLFCDDEVIDKIESERLWQIISTYPADIRKILYLFYAEDYSLPQISEKMNYSLSCVKHKLYRTLEDIRRKEQTND